MQYQVAQLLFCWIWLTGWIFEQFQFQFQSHHQVAQLLFSIVLPNDIPVGLHIEKPRLIIHIDIPACKSPSVFEHRNPSATPVPFDIPFRIPTI